MNTSRSPYHGFCFPAEIISHSVFLYHRFSLWRAIDQDGDSIDILLQRRCNGRAAKRFFRKLLKQQQRSPIAERG